MIDHDKLCELCTLLDDPEKGLKDEKQRQKVLVLVLYELHKDDLATKDYYIKSRGRGVVKATLTNTQAFHIAQIGKQLEIESIKQVEESDIAEPENMPF